MVTVAYRPKGNQTGAIRKPTELGEGLNSSRRSAGKTSRLCDHADIRVANHSILPLQGGNGLVYDLPCKSISISKWKDENGYKHESKERLTSIVQNRHERHIFCIPIAAEYQIYPTFGWEETMF